MLQNYFKIALRTLRKHTGYAFINITGLAVGIAVCMLIVLFVRHELSYDRFHEHADNIYRVNWNVGSYGKSATVPASLLPKFKEDFSEVEAAAHLLGRRIILLEEGEPVQEDDFYYADADVFDVFSFPLVAGDAVTALQAPNTVVLTQSAARRFFGEQDALGKTLTMQNKEPLRVTGILQDVPSNSHIQFDALISLATLTDVQTLSDQGFGFQGWMYLKLSNATAATTIDARLDEITDGGMESMSAYFGWAFDQSSFDLQPLTRIHLYSNLSGEARPNSDVRYLYIFSLVASFILLLACINYMNLATARSMKRAKEIGVRKTVGAGRWQLRGQFLNEALVLSGIALLLAGVIIEMLLPAFNQLTDRSLFLSYDPITLGLFVGLALTTGLVAGSYPALFLTRLDPIQMLRGSGSNQVQGGRLRQGLVVIQFTVSIALIAGTLMVQQQLDYLRNKRLGYDTTQIVQVPLRGTLKASGATFKAELERLSGIESAALSSGVPTAGGVVTTYGEDNQQQVRIVFGDPDYLQTMGMTLVDGQSFDPSQPADTSVFLVNELAARRFDLTDKIGQPEAFQFWKAATLTPLGIVSDFHTSSLHEPIMPTVIMMDPDYFEAMVLRLQKGQTAETLQAIEEVWHRFVPDEPFIYHFLDDMITAQYEAEQRLAGIFTSFSLVALLIACLGLFGLAAFMAEQRTKEIGIRKVLGATVGHLVGLLSKDFLKLVAVAFVIAVPIAYMVMQRWLENFAYRVEISVTIFLMAGSLALAIALATVSYQAIRTARANPVDSLRYE